ncbi:MAG: nitrite reductase [Thermodesulfobacteriota bacterium]|nr:nitrite reductase [Thermodesulfobacteriota bacterium]
MRNLRTLLFYFFIFMSLPPAMNSEDINKSYSVVPGLNMGLFSPKDFQTILNVINKYNVPATKITSAQRLALLGMDKEEMAALQLELKPYVRDQKKNGVHYVQACPGIKWCKYGIADSMELGKKIEELSFDQPLKAKVKVGVAGCRMCCTEPYVRDIGIIASKKGWSLVFGGNGAGKPRFADLVAKDLSDEEVLALIKKCITVYQEEARPKLRTARFMEKFGIEALKKRALEKE